MALQAETKSQIFTFLSTFLGRPATSLPKGAKWAVFFHDLEGRILPTIENAYKGERGTWNTSQAASVVLSDLYQTNSKTGCMFCQAISLPGEGFTPVAEGLKSNAFIRTYVGAGRNDFPVMRMSFLETNISFADTFLRGWALATAKYGMVARDGQEGRNYRTAMTCFKYSSGPNGLYIRQTIEFEGICCVGVTDEEFNYEHMGGPMKRDASFVYHSYSVNAVNGLDPLLLSNKPGASNIVL